MNPHQTDTKTSEELLQEYHTSYDPQVREQLIIKHLGLVTRLARRHSTHDDDLDDLVQVGYIGLMNAIDRYDPAKGVLFTTYAIPTIEGEIRRYLRDKGSVLRMPRQLHELRYTAARTGERLAQELGRQPTRTELAAALNVSAEDLEAAQWNRYLNLISLDQEVLQGDEEEASAAVRESLGREDEAMQRLADRSVLERALNELTSRERTILYLYFIEELSQAAIAGKLGISQMHVSRLQRQAIERMREALAHQNDTA